MRFYLFNFGSFSFCEKKTVDFVFGSRFSKNNPSFRTNILNSRVVKAFFKGGLKRLSISDHICLYLNTFYLYLFCFFSFQCNQSDDTKIFQLKYVFYKYYNNYIFSNLIEGSVGLK